MARMRTLVLAGVAAAAVTAALGLPAQAGAPAPGQAGPAQCAYPADVLDLTGWKLTLPTGEEEDPTEIEQPELDTFAVAPWFEASEDCGAVEFRAAVNGVTTGGSSYPRSELREMTADGEDLASWSTTDGTHTMELTLAFMALPNDKPEVVGAQVHGGDDDVTTFRLEGDSLYITDGDDSNHHLVTDDYELGTPFDAAFVAEDGEIDVYYNGQLETTISHEDDSNYFKAGAYTQANCGNSGPCDEDNYGEVHISALEVSHSG
ncbi:polysaccharide lyase family 7 protein [Streptomyces sp. 7-21]|uniref:polysaccharide lyase family 7 protein n=1 Tax=Streptomyces sp. 7-21 TaxID=2802283 RepID=UPI00191EF518|nr:polysaccharide lyase family 7 protein [Streptomyces sp. 7-21]MBL1065268.1 polysaccharide lyase family 7 protein [Streptomyces sp. 7-21]